MFRLRESDRMLQLEFTSELGNIDRMIPAVGDFLSRNGLAKMRFSVGLVCREGVINAMAHGNGMCRDKQVNFELALRDKTLAITIKDQGQGWDWAAQTGALPEAECERGRGLFLMGHYAESLEFNDKGDRLRILMDADVRA